MRTKRNQKNARPTRWQPSHESDELVFAVCDRFLKQLGITAKNRSLEPEEAMELSREEKKGAAASVSHWLKEHWGRPDLNREKIYPLFWEAAQRGFLLLQPPMEKLLADRISKQYQITDSTRQIKVVNSQQGEVAAKHVAAAAADIVVDLIEQVAQEKLNRVKRGDPIPAVHLGMGAGYATMLVAQRIARRVGSGVKLPPLVLHAISAGGFLANEPQKAPATYFSYFDRNFLDVECVTLFTETVVWKEDYDKIKLNPGTRRAFERKDEIDIFITSLAAAHHEHGLLEQFIGSLVKEQLLDPKTLENMYKSGWIGDVQFSPYSQDGPLHDICPVRAVTLFELEELVAFSQRPGKYVVLTAGPCGECGASKQEALIPLLKNEKLKLWTHLITDTRTAKQILYGKE
ncbi:MAG: sugar-binding domain-containing protein [Planctomycetaceae bacterium]|jgi:DNA-binding transcriptional regulator LsrR (DeoR family)|nr:sugar-binding domain-containing protein [Planctomycetaceae bacterium]